jgi:hypothetical protein
MASPEGMQRALKLAKLASKTNCLLDGTMAPIRKLLEDHETVLAVWPDSLARHGISCLVLKGRESDDNCRLSAIPCRNVEHAVALRALCEADAA